MDTQPNGFNPDAWKKAYDDADLAPELKEVKAVVEDIAQKSGLDIKPMSIDQAVNYWKIMEEQELDLVHAELGDETFVYMKGDRQEDVSDITGNIHSWNVFNAQAEAYKQKGDYDSLNKLLSIFGEGSYLKKEIERKLEGVKDDGGEYFKSGGFDPTPGKLLEVKRGTQYDIRPGMVDFRNYVEEGKLNTDRITKDVISKLAGMEIVYAEDWMEFDYTLKNIRKEYGEETADTLFKQLEKKYFETKNIRQE